MMPGTPRTVDRMEQRLADGGTVRLRDGLFIGMTRLIGWVCLLVYVLPGRYSGPFLQPETILVGLAALLAGIWVRLVVVVKQDCVVIRNLVSTIYVDLPARDVFEFDDWKLYVVEDDRRRFVHGLTGKDPSSEGRHLPGYGRRYMQASELLERISPASTVLTAAKPFTWD